MTDIIDLIVFLVFSAYFAVTYVGSLIAGCACLVAGLWRDEPLKTRLELLAMAAVLYGFAYFIWTIGS
jgi:hypothetical protein